MGKGSMVTKATYMRMLLVVLILACEDEWPCLSREGCRNAVHIQKQKKYCIFYDLMA